MAVHFRQRRGRLQAEREIIRYIHGSFLEEEHWPTLLSRVTGAFNSSYSAVLVRNRLTGAVRITASDALAPASQRAYEAYYARLNPRSFFERADFPIGEVFTDGLYSDYDAYRRSEIYNDFFRPLQADHLMFLALRHDSTEDMSLVVRRGCDIGPYGADAVTRLKRIGKHIATAEHILTKVREARDGHANFRTMFETLGVAVVVTDRAGRIRHLSASAKQQLRNTEALAVVGDRLIGRDANVDRDLQAVIRECADSIDNPSGATQRLVQVNGAGCSPATVHVSGMVWAGANGTRVPASFIVINEARDHRGDWAQGLHRLFGLTPSESRVVIALCEGRSLFEHAARAGISIETARTFLKRAREKTATHTQAALVGLISAVLR
jgi:DNA-binding CsgD family transcriptional regulator